MAAYRSPELTPGALWALISAATILLKRVIWRGPTSYWSVPRALRGTMSPLLLGMSNSSTWCSDERESAPAWSLTSKLLPLRVKSLI